MIRTVLTLALACLTTGCSRKADVWLIEADTTQGDGYSCVTEYNTNFSGPVLGSGERSSGSLTEVNEYLGPKALFYAKIVGLSTGQASLNSGGLLLPGEKDNGSWVFSWTAESTETTDVTHEADYEFQSIARSTATTTFELEFSGDTAEGSVTIERGLSTDQSESDTWGEEVSRDVGNAGRITWETRDGLESNDRDSSECRGDDCEKFVATVCGGTVPVMASRTDLSRDEDFSSLVTLVQYGVLRTSEESSTGSNDDTGY
ncbi:MAG TPA: hypothetical protein DFR83_25735 [Deltaproteobacteria bacterium]|nr:hypothetical protein [Deltaproteobacteria bacterium]